MASLLDCALFVWSPVLGDPHFMGWVTVAVYAMAALGSAWVAVRGPSAGGWRERLFWTLAAILLAVLAINKQLDLQSLLTALARCHAQLNGWYEGRRVIQHGFIIAVAAAGVVALIGLFLLLRGTLARTGLAVFGLGFVTLFVIVRAASFHDMDMLIGTWVGGVRVNWLLELPGPVLVLGSALRELWPTRT